MESKDIIPLPPAGIDLTADKGPVITAIALSTYTIAVVSVALRFTGRYMKGAKLWWDDWLVLASLVPGGAQVFVFGVWAVSQGVGKHVWAAGPYALWVWALSLWITVITYTFTLALVKWSILAVYWRSFSVDRSIRIPILVLATILLAWTISGVTVTIFQCLPVHSFWDQRHPYNPMPAADFSCPVNEKSFFIAHAVPTIVTDVIMIALPIPYIIKLRLPAIQRVGLTGIFLIGAFVTIVSIVRLNFLLHFLHHDLQQIDLTWNFFDTGIWSIIECNMAVLCACLPFFRPIIIKLSFGRLPLAPRPNKGAKNIPSTSRPSEEDDASNRFWTDDAKYGVSFTQVHATSMTDNESGELRLNSIPEHSSELELAMGKYDVEHVEEKELPQPGWGSSMEGIVITREFTMHSHSKS